MPTRREFMVSGSVVSALTAARVLPGSQLVAKRPTIGLGFSLYGMKSLAVTKAIDICADIGYDCIELPVQQGWPTDSLNLSETPEKIRGKLASRRVRLSALMENLHAAVDDQRHQSNLARLEAAGKLGHQLSPDTPPVVETILGGQPAEWDKIKMRMAERLQDWAEVAMATRTVIAIKAHVGGAMHLPEHPVWLMNQVNSPWIKCAYDYSHFELREVDMADSVKTLIPHSVFVHIKDSRGDAGHVQFLLPGDGDIDYVRLLNLIEGAGYRGDIFVEVSGQIHGQPGYDPVAAAKHCHTNLVPAFEKAGILRG